MPEAQKVYVDLVTQLINYLDCQQYICKRFAYICLTGKENREINEQCALFSNVVDL